MLLIGKTLMLSEAYSDSSMQYLETPSKEIVFAMSLFTSHYTCLCMCSRRGKVFSL